MKPIHEIAALLFCLAAVSCSDDAFQKIKEVTREADANIRLTGFRRVTTSPDGKRQWILSAEESYIYRKDQQQKRIVAYRFKFEQFDTAGRLTGILTGERAEINYEDNVARVTGQVTFVEPGKSRMTAGAMDYDLKTKILRSSEPVLLEEEGMHTNCRSGVVIDRANSRQVCRSPAVIRTSTGKKGESFDDVFK